MPLLKSLICIQGMDNGRRFLVINVCVYLLFLIIKPVLAKSVVLLLVFLVLSCPVMVASAIRRSYDSGFAKTLSAIPVTIFLLTVFGITFIEHGASYFLLILSVLATLAGTTISNAKVRRNQDYVMGYAGPIDIVESADTQVDAAGFERIEPTIVIGQSTNEVNPTTVKDEHSPQLEAELTHFETDQQVFLQSQQATNARSSTTEKKGQDWEQVLHQWFTQNRQLSLYMISAIVLITLTGIGWSLFNNEEEKTKTVAEQAPVNVAKERLNKLEMPDNYWLMMDKNDALTIAWQGDIKPDGELWSLVTAKGDKDCTNIRFENGSKVRSVLVTIKNEGDYYADFSPLDTAFLIEAIAKRSRFTLCGVDFSLKGTQAKLMSNRKYASYLESL